MRTKLEELHDALSEAVDGSKPTHDLAAALLVEMMACGAVRLAPTEPEKPPVFMVCGKCGSMHVRRDGDTMWDAERQEWDLAALFDSGSCDDCGGETEILEKPVEGASFDVQRRSNHPEEWEVVENFATLPEAERAVETFEKDEPEWEYRAIPV